MAEVVDVFEMPPVQAGMLLHTLMAPGAGIYFEQYWLVLEGRLDPARFRDAWDKVIQRHGILRSECHWLDLDRPVQVIYDQAAPEWHVADWQNLDVHEQDQSFTAWLHADRQRGFQLDKGPLLRFALIRIGPQRNRFVLSFHHVLMDGWCGALLVREMLRFYSGQDPAPAPAPYRRYIEWRNAQDGNAARAYWSTALAGCEVPTPLGIDRSDRREEGAVEIRQTISSDTVARLKEMAQKERVTLATVLQGAWALLLSRYSGDEDVVFGTVLSGRPPELAGSAAMIGFFLSTVPVRVRVPPSGSVGPWLRTLQAEQRQRERFAHVALCDIHRWSGLTTSRSLFDSLLIVENYPLSIRKVFELEGADLSLHEPNSYERTHFPLTLRVFPGETLECRLGIDLSRIGPEAAHRLLQHFENLLAAFAQDGGAPLGALELIGTAEREYLLRMGRGCEGGALPPVHEQILDQACATPNKTALVHVGEGDGVTVSFRQLAQRAAHLAALMRARGVGRGTVVAVGLNRGPDLVPALLAVMLTGAAYLPIDPDYPDERIANMLQDSGAGLMLTAAVTVRRRSWADLVDLLDIESCATGPSIEFQGPEHVGPDDLAYILYTSGSTGLPKGVAVSHGALSNFMRSMASEPGMAAGDRLFALTTIGFDIAGLELLGPLAQGGTVVLADTAVTRDGAKLVRLLERARPSLMQATPAGWRLLLDAGWKGSACLKVLCGGEALDADLATRLLDRGAELWNLYGPTETTIWSAALKVDRGMIQGPSLPVGGAIRNTRLYVLDERGALVPAGIPGELHIGGAGLSPGYWRKPALTAEKFIPNPFHAGEAYGSRLYRTGDRVRWREDGGLEFLGRVDGQIKLRGYRIEIGEIEGRLASHPMVAQAVVVACHEGRARQLVAYLRRRDGGHDDLAPVLRDYLAITLPAYMIPSVFVCVETFPLTPNGKVNRRALPAPQEAQGANAPAGSPVFGEPASTLAAIWREMLNIRHVGAQDHFFALGGHSLLVVALQTQIRERLGVGLDITDFFRFPTLETLAARILARGGNPLPEPATIETRQDARAAGRERMLLRRRRT